MKETPEDEMQEISQSPTIIDQRRSSTLYPARLPACDIRLLTVLPSNDFDATIECELRQYNNSKAPVYEALSYVWGAAKDVIAIICNGVRIHITTNLHNALRRFRGSSEPKIIWADALCLNQADVEEKNIPVPLMGDVYSKATNTAIYLGEASHKDAAAVEHSIMAIFDMLDSWRVPASVTEDAFNDSWFEHATQILSAQVDIDVCWSAVEAMFSAEWFERMWCIQEIALARDTKCSSYAMYGHIRLLYKCISATSSFLWFARIADLQFGRKVKLPHSIAAFTLLEYCEENENYLLDSLRVVRKHRATDPRDKVYRLLGILRQYKDFDASSITVDYARSLAEVYTEVAAAVVSQSRSLSILDEAAHSMAYEYDSAFPSWVPKWNRRAASRGFPLSIADNFRMEYPVSLRSRNEGPDDFMVYGDILLAHGTKYAEVASVWSLSDTALDTTVLCYWQCLRESESTYCGDKDRFLKMALTLSAGLANAGEEYLIVTDEKKDQFLADFLDYLHNIVPKCAHDCLGQSGQPAYKLSVNGTTYVGSQDRYGHILWLTRDGRSLFRMGSGDFGLGPDCMRDGDIIVGLLGGSSPYALRSGEKGYYFLGHVYVADLMDGTYFRSIYDHGKDMRQCFPWTRLTRRMIMSTLGDRPSVDAFCLI
jgi:hypothetical protein